MLGAGRYAVTGGAARHVVMIGTDVVRCDCADVHYRRRPCKHIRAVTEYLIVAPPRLPERNGAVMNAGPGLERDIPLPPEPDRAA